MAQGRPALLNIVGGSADDQHAFHLILVIFQGDRHLDKLAGLVVTHGPRALKTLQKLLGDDQLVLIQAVGILDDPETAVHNDDAAVIEPRQLRELHLRHLRCISLKIA